MKLFKYCFLTICLLFMFSLPSSANTGNVTANTGIEYLSNSDYLETVITQTFSTRSSLSGTKTTNYKNSAGSIMWSVSVNATFSYTYGKSSSCTSVNGSSASYSSAWSVSDATTSKSGNHATASATGYHYVAGILTDSLSRSVTLYCDSYGNLS